MNVSYNIPKSSSAYCRNPLTQRNQHWENIQIGPGKEKAHTPEESLWKEQEKQARQGLRFSQWYC
jgi:hypothetical protein